MVWIIHIMLQKREIFRFPQFINSKLLKHCNFSFFQQSNFIFELPRFGFLKPLLISIIVIFYLNFKNILGFSLLHVLHISVKFPFLKKCAVLIPI